ncbi:hypothetical protein B0H21DRAFT_821227 [Amylocystis lapponica]|nr:hypothetical protein B0H21DRAFT_821227 [Amylocystis lapponica]
MPRSVRWSRMPGKCPDCQADVNSIVNHYKNAHQPTARIVFDRDEKVILVNRDHSDGTFHCPRCLFSNTSPLRLQEHTRKKCKGPNGPPLRIRLPKRPRKTATGEEHLETDSAVLPPFFDGTGDAKNAASAPDVNKAEDAPMDVDDQSPHPGVYNEVAEEHEIHESLIGTGSVDVGQEQGPGSTADVSEQSVHGENMHVDEETLMLLSLQYPEFGTDDCDTVVGGPAVQDEPRHGSPIVELETSDMTTDPAQQTQPASPRRESLFSPAPQILDPPADVSTTALAAGQPQFPSPTDDRPPDPYSLKTPVFVQSDRWQQPSPPESTASASPTPHPAVRGKHPARAPGPAVVSFIAGLSRTAPPTHLAAVIALHGFSTEEHLDALCRVPSEWGPLRDAISTADSLAGWIQIADGLRARAAKFALQP